MIRQSTWLGAIRGVQLVGSIVQIPIIARLLGPEGYGVLAIFAAITSLLYNFLSIRGGETITTHVTRSVQAGRQEEAAATLRFALATALGLRMISYCLLVVFALTARGFLGVDSAHAVTLIVFGTTGLLLAVYNASLAVLRLADRVSLGLVVVSAGTLTQVAILLVAWVSGGGLFVIVMAYVAGAAVTGVGMFAAAVVSAPKAGLPGFLRSLSIRIPRDVINFHIASFANVTIVSLHQSMDVLLMTELSSIAQVGLYRAARSIIDSARTLFQPIMSGVQVELSRQWYSSERTALRRLVLRSTLLTIALAAAGFGLLAMFHEAVMQIILGSEFSSASQPLLIMIIGSSLAAATSALRILPAAMGRAGPPLIAATSSILISLATILWLVPRLGATGGAWANSIYFVIYTVILVPWAISILRRSFAK
ncbi:MAG: oligosaccharide flippase family protein [Truepera sp.]|nr:oligosaccharide flippase family protein [Truepera sp.]